MRWWVLVVALGCASGGSSDDAGPRTDGFVADGGADTSVADTGPPDEACIGATEGTPCDADGDGCTMDLCRRERCVLGGAADCDDGLGCTTDSCVSTGPMTFMCSSEVAAGSCAIGAVCVSNGMANPADECQVCDASSPEAWSVNTGSCDDGDACTMGDSCATGTCTGNPMLDAYEGNNTRAAAHDLGGVSDRDTFGEESFNDAAIYPDGDEDWYRYFDDDDIGGSIFPQVYLQNIPSGSNYDLCVTVSCDDGLDSLDCEMGTKVGSDTCCSRSGSNADERVRIDHSCDTFTDDSATIFIQVVKVGGPASCTTPYEIIWGDG